jgi:hypothetical protein
MNTEGVIHPDEERPQPLVQWFPSGGIAAATPAVAAGAAALVLGALFYAGFSLARSLARGGRSEADLVLDRLVVRKLTVLED